MEDTFKLSDLRRVEFRPGDKVIWKVPVRNISAEHAEYMRKVWNDFAPGVPVLILPEGCQLDILSEESA